MLDGLVCFRGGEQEKHQSGVKTVFHLKKQVHLRFFLVLRLTFCLRRDPVFFGTMLALPGEFIVVCCFEEAVEGSGRLRCGFPVTKGGRASAFDSAVSVGFTTPVGPATPEAFLGPVCVTLESE